MSEPPWTGPIRQRLHTEMPVGKPQSLWKQFKTWRASRRRLRETRRSNGR